MRRILLLAMLAVSGACVLDGVTCHAQSPVTSISIQSSWGGLGQPSSSQLVITHKKGHFQSGGRRVSDEAVHSFLRAVEESSQQDFGLIALGITGAWLTDRARAALREYLPHWQYKDSSDTQKQLFIGTFSNPDHVKAALSRYGIAGGLDDYPEIAIRITKANGETYAVESKGDPDFLYYWLVTRPNGSFETANAAISLSLWRLLPPKFTNRERLSEKALRHMIAETVMTSIREKWDAVGAEAKLGSAIVPVTQRFDLLSSAVSGLLSIDLNGAESWNAKLRNSSLPLNVEIGLSLPIRENRLIGVDAFLQRIADCVRTAMSPTWLREFLAAHPEAKIEIRFVEDRSLSRYAEQRFVEDMVKLGKAAIAQDVSSRAADVVFLKLYFGSWSRWIVLPNGEMVLWQFQGERVGNWSEQDFKFSECYGWKCVGTIIPEDGSLK